MLNKRDDNANILIDLTTKIMRNNTYLSFNSPFDYLITDFELP